MSLQVRRALGGVFLQFVICQQRACEHLYNADHTASYGYWKDSDTNGLGQVKRIQLQELNFETAMYYSVG